MESLRSVPALTASDGGILADEVALLAAADAPLVAAAAASIIEWEAAGPVMAIQQTAELVQIAHDSAAAENCNSHPAVAAAAAAVLLTQAVLSSAHCTAESVLRQCRVPLYDNDLATSLVHLDRLQAALEHIPRQWAGPSAPGFVTAEATDGERNTDSCRSTYSFWAPIPGTPYEKNCRYFSTTLENSMSSIARSIIPSPDFAIACCQKIRPVLSARLACVEDPIAAKKLLCKCLTEWDHFNEHISYCLVNQALEQFMVREASDSLDNSVLPDEWDKRYAPEHCPVPIFPGPIDESSRIRVLLNRDAYIQNLVKLALASRRSIQIATCYLFATDPAALYIILDLLPYCARTNGVTIEILVDSLTIESAVVRSAFFDADMGVNPARKIPGLASTSNITAWSFADKLPYGAPEPAQAHRSFDSPLHFVEELDRVVAANPTIHVRWWCARDKDMQYRIKNHCKCFIADQEAAMVGGSNLAPTVSAAESELDLLLWGPVVEQVSASFDSMWRAMDNVDTLASESTDDAGPITQSRNAGVEESERNCLRTQLDESSWDDDSARVSLVRSFPSSAGEDAIYRMVLGALQIAKKRIIMSMGHSNYPKSLARVLAAATGRGVQVQVLANSKYSCDLLVNQRDLMLSCRDLLRIAPDVELYLTFRKPGGPRPPFAHAKYVTMDGTWSAIGSWNVWTRGAFYELEHEAMIESTAVASLLEEKFQFDRATTVRVVKPEDLEPGGAWCPAGCSVCRGFGPFFRP